MNKIESFWRTFLNAEVELSRSGPDQDVMDQVLQSLREIDPGLYYDVGLKDEGADVILSAEGQPDLMRTIDDIKQAAPSLPNWGVVCAFDGLGLFGQRNTELFPETINGDVLYKMYRNGDKQWIPRPVDFALVFPDHSSAASFAQTVGNDDDIACEVDAYEGADGFTHQAEVTITLAPTYRTITQREAFFGRLAQEYGGRNDGGGCFEVREES